MIVVHHLNNSRSQRIIWLLEELGVPYEVRRYERDGATMLAPPELRAVHPLGKSPVIDDDGRAVAESGAIVEYLAATYGAGTSDPAGRHGCGAEGELLDALRGGHRDDAVAADAVSGLAG